MPATVEISACDGAAVCATCGPVSWMWSLRREAWVAFIPDLGDRELYRLHRCEHAQDPKTWRQVRAGDPPSPEYRKTRSKIAGRGSADV